MDSKSRYTLRTDPVLLEKLGYIAEYEGRTKNRELEQMIKRRIVAGDHGVKIANEQGSHAGSSFSDAESAVYVSILAQFRAAANPDLQQRICFADEFYHAIDLQITLRRAFLLSYPQEHAIMKEKTWRHHESSCH